MILNVFVALDINPSTAGSLVQHSHSPFVLNEFLPSSPYCSVLFRRAHEVLLLPIVSPAPLGSAQEPISKRAMC